MDVADVADAEGVGFGDFSWVEDVAFALHKFVEVFEVEVFVGVEEGRDDGRLELFAEQGLEAERVHAFGEAALVFRVAFVARLYAALFAQFFLRFDEGADDVGRRGEAPFAVSLFHDFPLVVEVERYGARAASAFFEFGAARDDERKSGDALYALVGAAYHEVYAEARHVYRHAAEAAHRVYDEDFAAALDFARDALDVVEDSRRRLAVNHEDVRHVGVFVEEFRRLRSVGALGLAV